MSCWEGSLCATRIQELQQALAEAQQETAQALAGRQEALAEAGARLADAEAAGELAVSAQEAADDAPSPGAGSPGDCLAGRCPYPGCQPVSRSLHVVRRCRMLLAA